ncbi:hypothetical protein ACFZB9_02225 [Kitasatospora sp. NPDC008050]
MPTHDQDQDERETARLEPAESGTTERLREAVRQLNRESQRWPH